MKKITLKRSFLPSVLTIVTFFSFLSPIYAKSNNGVAKIGNSASAQIHTLANPPTTPSTNPTNIGMRTVGSEKLNVRSAPKLGNNIIGHLNKGDKVTVIKKDATGFWCNIEFNGNTNAWVACKYLKM